METGDHGVPAGDGVVPAGDGVVPAGNGAIVTRLPVCDAADGSIDTGDGAVDEVLRLLGTVTGESLDLQIEVGERARRVLQGRLADLGQE